MKTYYDSFVLCQSNRNTYIQPHTVMKSRYTNVKYHCEISWYFSVHCLPQSLWNYKEEARIKPSENALAMPGQQALELQVCIQAGHHVATAASSGALITTWSPWQLWRAWLKISHNMRSHHEELMTWHLESAKHPKCHFDNMTSQDHNELINA